MMKRFQAAGVALAVGVAAVSVTAAQSSLVDLMARHGVEVRAGRIEAAFDAHVTPTVPPTSGSFAIPLAILSSTTGPERVDAAYAFGILAGRSGRAGQPQELAAAGQSLIQMIHSEDRRSRVAGARVSGRLFAAPFDRTPRPSLPPGLVDALFTVLNQDADVEQLAAMDALGLIREVRAVTSLTERYRYYRDVRRRALAGGALEALARIGDASSVELARQLAGDSWADGRDATALACAFARERLLRDGSIAIIQQALDDKSRRDQARGYLAELGAPVP